MEFNRVNWQVQKMAFGHAWMLFLLAFFLGVLAAVFPWWFVLALCFLVFIGVISWFAPVLSVMLVLALQFGVLSKIVPRIPLGGGGLNPEDLAIPILLFIYAVKNYGLLIQKLDPLAKYIKPLSLFLACAFVSVVIALVYKTAPAKDVLNEFRPFFTWLLFPLLCLAIDNERKFSFFLKALFVLSTIVAVGMLVQSFTGYQIFEKGQSVRDLYTLGGSTKGVKRSETAAQFLMAGALVFIFSQYAFGKMNKFLVMLFATPILVGGIAVGFGRGLWLSVLLSIFVLGFYAKPANYIKFAIFACITFVLSATAISAYKPDYVDAVISRFSSATQEVEYGSSLGRRTEENIYAIDRVFDNPLLGVGLGGQFKPFGRDSLVWESESRYIHNSYVRIVTKLGVPGLLIAIWLVLVFWLRTYRIFRDCSVDPAIAFTCFWTIVTTTLLTAATQPNLAAQNGVATIVIALFVAERLRYAKCHDERPIT